MPKSKKSKRQRSSAGTAVLEETYSVEKILQKKVTSGKTYYFLKWFGYPDSENTWEPVENLDCPELIAAFEKGLTKKTKAKTAAEPGPPPSGSSGGRGASSRRRLGLETDSDTDSDPLVKQSQNGEEPQSSGVREVKEIIKHKSGFERGLEAQDILGATEQSGQIFFLIKW